MVLSGCGTFPRSAPTLPPLLNPASPLMNQAAPDTFKVLFETTEGDFVVEVVREWAPLGADRFYNLVRNDYFNTVPFFRVAPGFVVQFGLHGIPPIAAAWREARIPDDSVRVSNRRGLVTFATSGPNTRTTQLFINLADNTRLDTQGFAPFGRVTGGMDVVDRFYAGYGEGPPRGRGPEQERIQSEGTPYLQSEFPQLDYVIRARIIAE